MEKSVILNNQIFKVVAFLEKIGNQIFSKCGLTVKTYSILVAISEGCSKSTELANRIQGSKANITQKTKVLEKKGLIYRELDQKDKRIWYFKLTKKGNEILDKILPDYEKAVEELYRPFSKKEMDETIKIFEILEYRLMYALKNKVIPRK